MAMKTKSSILFATVILSCLLSWTAELLQAQTQPPPKPGPEQKKLEVFVGKWEYKGTEQVTPLGEKGDFTGTSTMRLLANGFVLEAHDVEKDKDWLGVIWYDAAAKTYMRQHFEPGGNVVTGRVTVDGNTWATTSDLVDLGGKHYKTRDTWIFSPNGESLTWKSDYSSDDGKTWSLRWELTSKKVGK